MYSKPIKVLHLIPTLSSGGAERQLVNLVASTSKKLINHVVCVMSESEFFAPSIRNAGYKVIDLNISGKRPFFQTASKFRRIMREEKPDIIHSWLYDANIAARLANLFNSNIPIITSLQLPDYEPEAALIGNWSPHKVRGLKAIDKFTTILAKPYFVPCSEFVKNSYKRHYGINEEKTTVIYNSVNADVLSATQDDLKKIHEEFALPPNAFIFLNVGRLDPQKNHRVMFTAFQEISSEIPNAVLLLAGVGGLDGELKKLAKDLKIADKVHFLGRRNDIGVLLEFADVFLFPSCFEGMGIALVEAMFKSLPCIASRIEVLEEVLTDEVTGLLIDPTLPEELKQAMVRLYNDSNLRKSLSENALEAAKVTFNVDVTAKQWEDFYQKVISKL